MGSKMRAVAIKDGKGPASALSIEEIPFPTPKPAEAIVKIKCFGLNRMDLLQREGWYPVPPQAPSTLGVEFSGVVHRAAENGEGEQFAEGDEVFGLAYGGAYAEYIAVSAHMLIHKPKELSWEEAAGIPEVFITATQALYLVGGFEPGKSVLWHAGASSVSLAGIQLSVADSASAVFVTASSGDKIELAKSLGATDGFSYKTQDWAQEVLRATGGRGVDIIVDFVGASYFQGNLACAARDGRVVLLGMMGGTQLPAGTDISNLLMKRVRYEGSTLRSRDEGYQRKLRDMLVEHALPRLVDGRFKVIVEKVFDWADVAEAHRLMESNSTKGKIICRID